MSGPGLPATLVAYRIATALAASAAPLLLARRVRRGKEDPDRVGERLGHPGRARPPGDLVWAHGASVGETQSLLPLVAAIVERGTKVLLTSGTRTAAELLAQRLPPGARHQYVPVDVPGAVGRFLDHWRPALALFAESEVWPNTVLALHRRAVPLVLVNGRMSAGSGTGWLRVPAAARAVFGRFALCLPQGEADAARLAALGAPVAGPVGNLKFDVPPPAADPATVEALAGRLAGRPVWLAASTHAGEEAAIVTAHAAMRASRPDLLTVIAPRHPGRGREIAALAARSGLAAGLRSRGEPVEAAADGLHVADTLGELGLFFRIAPLVLMGGSLVPAGGHNPIEPVRLGAAVLHGPHVANFEDVYGALDAAGGAQLAGDSDAIATAVLDLLSRPARLRDMARRGRTVVDGFGGALARTLAAIEPYLPARQDPRAAIW